MYKICKIYITGGIDDVIELDENGNVISWGGYTTYIPQENELSLQEYSEDLLLVGNVKHEILVNTYGIGFNFDFYFEFKPENQTTDDFLEFMYHH